MSIKAKVAGLALLATMVMGVVGVMNVTAESGGHFLIAEPSVTIVGTEEGEHQLAFSFDEGNPIVCDSGSYQGEMDEGEATAIAFEPSWDDCHTEGSEGVMTIKENGCQLILTAGKEPEKDNTAHIACEGENTIELEHPNCLIRIPPQTVGSGGVAYTTAEMDGRHALAAEVTAEELTSHFEQGFCTFLGTTHKGALTGSMIIQALAAPVLDITISGE